MRSKIIHALLLLFILFFAGAGTTMLYLYKTTTHLKSVINLHQVEIIRQDLVIRAQSVQSQLYSFGTAFGAELDVIVDNVIELDKSAHKCLQCHHNKDIARRLQQVVALVEQYQDALSYLITTSANAERIDRLKTVAIGTGNKLLSSVQEMAKIAGQKLNDKTFRSLNEINNSKVILIITLILSFFIAIAIAVTMTRQVTEPIYELLTATRRIKAGEFGYTMHYRVKGEFGELVNAFNEMSVSLDESNRKVMHHLNSLSNLYSVTLTFHSITNAEDIYREVAYGVAEIVDAQQCGLMLLDGERFVHTYPAVGMDRDAIKNTTIPKKTFLDLYMPSNRRAFIQNEGSYIPGLEDHDRKLNVRNLMLVWIRRKGELVGAIRVANKVSGDFTEEDVRPLAILANNISVAMDNAALYDDLRRQMKELQDAQQQLVQAAKLVAIGELASNVAHELNNPLTTVLGYTELMKEEEDMDGMMKDLDVIEKESLRAREIVRQLLEFARRRDLNIQELNINDIITDVIDFIFIQKRHAGVVRKLDLGSIPPISGDENQLKQVFVNLINNAIYAMKSDGTLSIRTHFDNGYIHAIIADTGEGIPSEFLSRIFEPFFSTKKEKGTGIGLSVSFKIIQSHNGTIDVESEPGKGTIFTIALPAKGILSQQEEKPPATQSAPPTV